MSKYELKTKKNSASVTGLINAIPEARKRADAKKVLAIMKKITGEKPVMWGTSIIGFGTYHYKYASGQEGDWMITGFSPRKQNLTIYIMPGYNLSQPLLKKLGKHKTGKSCLYINKLEDIDLKILEQLIDKGYKEMKKKYPIR
jgi:hypothetical protein